MIPFKRFLAAFALFLLFAMPGAFAVAQESDLVPTLPEIPESPGWNANLPTYLKWVFDAGMVVGVGTIILALIISGIYFVLSGSGLGDSRAKAKEWLSGAVSGFLILTLLYLIITTLNPALAFFRFGDALTIPDSSPEKKGLVGVFGYESPDCTGKPIPVSDTEYFGSDKKIRSIESLVDESAPIWEREYYDVVVFDRPNKKGVCQNAIAQTPCMRIDDRINDIGSILIDKTSVADIFGSIAKPKQIIFYRNPGFGRNSNTEEFNDTGGYLLIQTGEYYEEDLSNLAFTGENPGSSNIKDCTVPEDEQDCARWDNEGKCVEKKCPLLEDDGISAMEIGKDNVVAVLSYYGPGDTATVHSFCQAYPEAKDINDAGPRQVRWDLLRWHSAEDPQTKQVLTHYPNHIRIFTIKQ